MRGTDAADPHGVRAYSPRFDLTGHVSGRKGPRANFRLAVAPRSTFLPPEFASLLRRIAGAAPYRTSRDPISVLGAELNPP